MVLPFLVAPHLLRFSAILTRIRQRAYAHLVHHLGAVDPRVGTSPCPVIEHDRNLEVNLRHPGLEIEPAQTRQQDIEHEAAGNIRRRAGEELLRGRKGLDF